MPEIQPVVGVFPAPAEGDFRDCPECPEMVVLPAGGHAGRYQALNFLWPPILVLIGGLDGSFGVNGLGGMTSGDPDGEFGGDGLWIPPTGADSTCNSMRAPTPGLSRV